MDERIRIGVSTCLLGENVRFDGGNKHDAVLTAVFGPHVEWVSICPELEVGMGVPREAVRLVGTPSAPGMVGVDSGEDWTSRMLAWSEGRVAQLGKLRLSGYVLKSRSPSCGLEGVTVYDTKATARKDGTGLFAGVLIKGHPLLPVVEEGRLNDSHLRENFIVRIFGYRRLRGVMDGRFSPGKLAEFHAAEKYLLMAHSPAHYLRLGALMAKANMLPPVELRKRYAALFMECLNAMSTVKKNVDVLRRIAGSLSPALPAGERKEILHVLQEYRRGSVPLLVPVTLLRHHARIHSIAHVVNQVYLNPHPKELMLRNHV